MTFNIDLHANHPNMINIMNSLPDVLKCHFAKSVRYKNVAHKRANIYDNFFVCR